MFIAFYVVRSILSYGVLVCGKDNDRIRQLERSAIQFFRLMVTRQTPSHMVKKTRARKNQNVKETRKRKEKNEGNRRKKKKRIGSQDERKQKRTNGREEKREKKITTEIFETKPRPL